MISGVVYLLRILKMFHGLMNNPVFINCNWVVTRWQWLFYLYTNMKKSN